MAIGDLPKPSEFCPAHTLSFHTRERYPSRQWPREWKECAGTLVEDSVMMLSMCDEDRYPFHDISDINDLIRT